MVGARSSSVGPGTRAPSTTVSTAAETSTAVAAAATAAAATGNPAAILESAHYNTDVVLGEGDQTSLLIRYRVDYHNRVLHNVYK